MKTDLLAITGSWSMGICKIVQKQEATDPWGFGEKLYKAGYPWVLNLTPKVHPDMRVQNRSRFQSVQPRALTLYFKH